MNDPSRMSERANRPGGRISGGEALAHMLAVHEAGPILGMGGFQLLPFYDAIGRAGLRHSLINDERCGAFAADAWARITGRPGLCDATLGPGATNLTTGLVESLNAGVPLIAITGDANRQHAWKNMTQEARQIEILRPAVKEVIRIEVTARIPELVRRAYQVATSGRPGPVLLDVPEDVCHDVHEFDDAEFRADAANLRIPAYRTRPAADDLERAAALLARARRPILLAGGGVHLSGATAALKTLSRDWALPVAHTMSGKGAIACTDALSLGLFGRYSRTANDVLEQADCILVVGCKLGEIATKRFVLPPPGVPLIHLDIVAEEIGRTTRTDVGLWGDAAAGLADLHAALGPGTCGAGPDRDAYLAEIAAAKAAWRREVDGRLTSAEVPVSMARLCHELNQVLPAEAILVTDGGFAAHWTGLLYDTKQPGRGVIANRGFASIGYGLPGSIGAALAAPGRPVVGLTGDGGLNMVIGELETARRLGLGMTLIVVNNAASGYVKALQHTLFDGHYQSSDLAETNYADVANAMACQGIRIEAPGDFAAALRTGLAETGRPTVIDVVVTRDPAKMLPGVDNRAAPAKKGDRIA